MESVSRGSEEVSTLKEDEFGLVLSCDFQISKNLPHFGDSAQPGATCDPTMFLELCLTTMTEILCTCVTRQLEVPKFVTIPYHF